MKKFLSIIHKLEFEYRIFVSFSIVIVIYTLSITVYEENISTGVLIFHFLGSTPASAITLLYLILACFMVVISALRMWAGSILSSQTVMSFRIQADSLVVDGPYLLVRNPIYLADLLAMSCFAVCLPPIGILMPVFFYFHYIRLIQYEEISFKKNFKKQYTNYINRVPRLLATPKSIFNFILSEKKFVITRDGFRHNALYLLFIPGFLIAAFTQNFLIVVLVGIPGVIDWAIVHTKIGLGNPQNNCQKAQATTDQKKKIFDDIVYAQCWEDPSIDRIAFNIQSDDVIFSITSGGDNVLTFLIDNPSKVIALDLNPHQNYLLALKIAAFKQLSYEKLLELFGITVSSRRIKLYQWLRFSLDNPTRQYWDDNLDKIKTGIIHCGRYERYMKLLRRGLELTMGKSLIKKFFQTEHTAERLDLYNKKWDNIWWKIFTRILLSRKTMSFLFDKSFFTYLDNPFSFGEHFAQKVKRAFTVLPFRSNYFLNYILLGNYDAKNALPAYLQKCNYNQIRSRVDRIDIVTESCDHLFSRLPEGYISKFNFSNIFEWMPLEECENLLKESVRVARDGAILAYRNLLVPRKHPPSLFRNIRSHDKLASRLHERDLSFIYNNYVVEQVIKEKKQWPMKSKKYLVANH